MTRSRFIILCHRSQGCSRRRRSRAAPTNCSWGPIEATAPDAEAADAKGAGEVTESPDAASDVVDATAPFDAAPIPVQCGGPSWRSRWQPAPSTTARRCTIDRCAAGRHERAPAACRGRRRSRAGQASAAARRSAPRGSRSGEKSERASSLPAEPSRAGATGSARQRWCPTSRRHGACSWAPTESLAASSAPRPSWSAGASLGRSAGAPPGARCQAARRSLWTGGRSGRPRGWQVVELGYGPQLAHQYGGGEPRQVFGLIDAEVLAVGSGHACARTGTGSSLAGGEGARAS